MADKEDVSFPSISLAPSEPSLASKVPPRSIIQGTIGGTAGITVGTGSGVNIQGDTGIYAGGATAASSPFYVDLSGNLRATSATITGGSLTVGTDPNAFHVDSAGNMWLGASTFAAAPAKISNSGSLTAKSVSILDSSNTSIVDSTGIVSTTQFSNGSVSIANSGGSFTTNTTLSTDIPNLTISFTLVRTANVLLFAQVGGGCTNAGNGPDYGKFQLAVDGTVVGGPIALYGNWYLSGGVATLGVGQSGTPIVIASLSSGSHTLTCRYATTNASFSAYATDQTQVIGYAVLGK